MTALADDAYLVAVAAYVDPAGPAGWGAVVQRGPKGAEFQQHVCRVASTDAVLDMGRAHVQAMLHVANRPIGHGAKVMYQMVKNEVWIIEPPTSGAASIALYNRALVLAKRAALQPCAVASVRFGR